MKRIVFLISALIVSSCALNNAPVVIDENYSPSTDSLYAQCADLKGVGDFIIGKTTFSQVLRSPYYKHVSKLMMHNNLYNGYWGCANKHEKYEKSSWLEENAKHIKQFPHPELEFKMGELKFDDFDLAFLNDTLVAIYYVSESETIHEHYIDKYGTGVGSYYSYHLDNEPCKDRSKLKVTDTKKEERVWENESVKLQYHLSYHFEMGPDISSSRTFYDDSWYLLTSKKRYPVFLEELEKMGKQYDDLQKEENENVLNQL